MVFASEGLLEFLLEFCICAEDQEDRQATSLQLRCLNPTHPRGTLIPRETYKWNACSSQRRENYLIMMRDTDRTAGQLCQGGASGSSADTH